MGKIERIVVCGGIVIFVLLFIWAVLTPRPVHEIELDKAAKISNLPKLSVFVVSNNDHQYYCWVMDLDVVRCTKGEVSFVGAIPEGQQSVVVESPDGTDLFVLEYSDYSDEPYRYDITALLETTLHLP